MHFNVLLVSRLIWNIQENDLTETDRLTDRMKSGMSHRQTDTEPLNLYLNESFVEQ